MEIARIERIEKNTFVVYVRFPDRQELGSYTAALTIIISEDYFVTVCPSSCHIIKRILESKSSLKTNMRAKLHHTRTAQHSARIYKSH